MGVQTLINHKRNWLWQWTYQDYSMQVHAGTKSLHHICRQNAPRRWNCRWWCCIVKRIDKCYQWCLWWGVLPALHLSLSTWVYRYSSQYNQFDFSKKHTISQEMSINQTCNLIFAIRGSSSEMETMFWFPTSITHSPTKFPQWFSSLKFSGITLPLRPARWARLCEVCRHMHLNLVQCKGERVVHKHREDMAIGPL